MVADPDCPAAGVTVTVRFPPDPPSTIPDCGTSVVSDELAVTVRLAAGVSASETVNDSGPIVPFSATVWSVTSEIVGGVFGGLTVNPAENSDVSPVTLSVAVAVITRPTATATGSVAVNVPTPPAPVVTSADPRNC